MSFEFTQTNCLNPFKYLSFGALDLCILHQSAVPRPGLYHNAGVRLVTSQPVYPHELLWVTQLPGTVPALRSVGLLDYSGQHDLGGSNGHGRWPYLLLPRGCLPEAARWLPNLENAFVSVSPPSI